MSKKAQGRDGLPLRLAIIGFATEQWRENAAIYARLEASPRIRAEHIAGTQKLLWSESLLLRLLDGELVAYGVPDGGRVAEAISHDILRDAEPDFRANTLTCGITFRSIRIYEIATAPEIAHSDPAAPIPSGGEETPGQKRAWEWMAKNVSTGGSWKREVALQRCHDEAEVTFREAIYGWSKLDPTIKGTPGAKKNKTAP